MPYLFSCSSSHFSAIFLNWSRGQPATLDVTAISTLQAQTPAGAAAHTQGHTRLDWGREKDDSSTQYRMQVGVGVFLFVFPSLRPDLGRLERGHVCDYQDQHTGSPTRGTKGTYSQRLWKGNDTHWILTDDPLMMTLNQCVARAKRLRTRALVLICTC